MAVEGSGSAVSTTSSIRNWVVVSAFVQRSERVGEIGMLVLGMETNRQTAVPVPVGCAGMGTAVQLDPSVL